VRGSGKQLTIGARIVNEGRSEGERQIRQASIVVYMSVSPSA
jgi:hypothetical protein